MVLEEFYVITNEEGKYYAHTTIELELEPAFVSNVLMCHRFPSRESVELFMKGFYGNIHKSVFDKCTIDYITIEMNKK